MSTSTVSARYSSALGLHDVVVTRDQAGRWQVLDVLGSTVALVETLTGHDDRLDQAEALARDYAAQQQAHHDGWRADPLPRAKARIRTRRNDRRST